jgi:hypothetical protein
MCVRVKDELSYRADLEFFKIEKWCQSEEENRCQSREKDENKVFSS